MLKRLDLDQESGFMDFRSVSRYGTGVGVCYVYNVVLKSTKAGKPFVTLFLRDINGATVPGYIFDLASPLLAGKEAREVLNHLVQVKWQENYLDGIGLTFILDKVEVVKDTTPDQIALFRGEIQDSDTKYRCLSEFLREELGCNISIPVLAKTHSSPDYYQGRVGGLLEHYCRVSKILLSVASDSKEERRQLIAAFVLYILVHSNYTRAAESGMVNISLASVLTEKVAPIATALKATSGALEMVHLFFGYTPKDIYVKTVQAAADLAKRVDAEFSVYKTVPVEQEGDAGYGKIRRYILEE